MEQSDPPRIGLSKFFPDGIYPEGEIQPYKDECVLLQCVVYSNALVCFLVMRGAPRPRKSDTMNGW